jgi:hypothetical protein
MGLDAKVDAVPLGEMPKYCFGLRVGRVRPTHGQEIRVLLVALLVMRLTLDRGEER